MTRLDPLRLKSVRLPHLPVAFVLRVTFGEFPCFSGFLLRWLIPTTRLQQTFTFLKQTLIALGTNIAIAG
jgi:hypothetical protein